MLSHLYKSAGFKEDLSCCESSNYKNSFSRKSSTNSENVSIQAYNDMSLVFLFAVIKSMKSLHSSLKKALHSLKSLYRGSQ